MDKPTIHSLKGALAEFGKGHSAASLVQGNIALEHYFTLFDFPQLDGIYDNFDLGSISSGDYRLACMRWSRSDAHADVLVAHGLFDHVGLYLPLIKSLLQNGVNVIAFDLPEHGLSSGDFGEISSFDTYSRAFEDVLTYFELSRSRPLVALGQSTGAAVILNYILGCQKRRKEHLISKLVMFAPLLRVRAWKRINLSYFMFRAFLRQVPRDFSTNSHDDEFCRFLKHQDPLQPREISVSWVKAMLDWANHFKELGVENVPGLLLQGTEDQTVDGAFNLPHIMEKFPCLSICEIEGAYHHLVREAEPWQAQVFEELSKVLEGVQRAWV